ncbi:hypothetical protein [Pelagerythrobacter sp.]|uniref:hypothetical protein n=1 Tax=Pelagerythrobacter sp. TaxID=2800702 RepID=UPI0035B48948
MVQIGGNLRSEEFAQFQDYVSSLLITESSLANLLVQRELRLKRLGDLAKCYQGAVTTAERGGRVTGHQSTGELRQAFEERAVEAGLALGHAATILFRAELEDRWLEGCLGDSARNHIDSETGTS